MYCSWIIASLKVFLVRSSWLEQYLYCIMSFSPERWAACRGDSPSPSGASVQSIM